MGALVISCLAIAAIALGTASSSPFSPSSDSAQWTGVVAPLPLGDAARQANDRAGAWQEDAALIRVEASWRPGPRWLDHDVPPVAWSFYYYSPAAGAVATVAVDAEHTMWVPPVVVARPPALLDSFPPAYGIEMVWLTFRAAGGRAFIEEHPNASVAFRLQTEDGQAIWRVAAIEGDAHLVVRMSADTGVVLSP